MARFMVDTEKESVLVEVNGALRELTSLDAKDLRKAVDVIAEADLRIGRHLDSHEEGD